MYRNKAILAREKRDFENSKFLINLCVEIDAAHSLKQSLGLDYMEMGKLMKAMSMPEEAIKYLEMSRDLFKEVGNEIEMGKAEKELNDIS